MAAYLLVHGAWHGAWCWQKTVAALKSRGETAMAIDLPGHGKDATPRTSVTIESYVARIGEALDAMGGKPILVGHSMGGIAISAAAQAHAQKISRLVYMTAFLPRDGESLLTIEGRNPAPAVPPALVVDEASGTATLQNDKIVSLFYHDCSAEDQRWATSMLTPQPLAPLGTPLTLTNDRFGTVPRSYIACTDDRAISIFMQRDMIAASGVEKVLELDASHSPFLSKPDELAALLVKAA
jgi:pimeloyl-ACP methyl ester carboxylesterase